MNRSALAQLIPPRLVALRLTWNARLWHDPAVSASRVSALSPRLGIVPFFGVASTQMLVFALR